MIGTPPVHPVASPLETKTERVGARGAVDVSTSVWRTS
jgi:hypothetical protein